MEGGLLYLLTVASRYEGRSMGGWIHRLLPSQELGHISDHQFRDTMFIFPNSDAKELFCKEIEGLDNNLKIFILTEYVPDLDINLLRGHREEDGIILSSGGDVEIKELMSRYQAKEVRLMPSKINWFLDPTVSDEDKRNEFIELGQKFHKFGWKIMIKDSRFVFKFGTRYEQFIEWIESSK